MADIFLSYKKEDRAVAERLVGALRATGKSVWWDDALNPAQAWDAMIEREIAAARVVRARRARAHRRGRARAGSGPI